LADIACWNVDKLAYAGSLSDPSAALLFCGYDHAAEMVIVNGKIVVDNGRIVCIDEEKLKEDANKVALRLYKKAGIT